MEKMFYTNRNQKRAEVSTLTSDKIDIKSKTITRDKGGHYTVDFWTMWELVYI